MPAQEKAATQQIGLQFSLYPLRQEHVRPAIQAAVKAAGDDGVALTVGKISTAGAGEEDAVFAAVRSAFAAARSFGPAVMVVTLSSVVPGDEAVTAIQTGARR